MKASAGTLTGWNLAATGERLTKLERGDLLVEPATSADGSIPGVFVEAILSCPPRRVWDLLRDYEALPDAIFGLDSAQTLTEDADSSTVRFTMKLPFPVGTMSWTNRIYRTERAGAYSVSWEYVDGDLKANSGRLLFGRHGDDEARTYARYQVMVAPRSRLPRSAQRLATRWLLPRVFQRLRRIAEKSA